MDNSGQGQNQGYQQTSPPNMSQNTNVVVNVAPGLQRPPEQQWTTGICGCFEDIGTCCIGYFCPLFLACQVASQMKESCFVPLCVQGGPIAMRTKLRTLYNIEGSICCDCCATTYCGPLALCQMAREMKNRGM